MSASPGRNSPEENTASLSAAGTPHREGDLFSARPLVRWVVLAALFTGALAIRAHRIEDPPLEYNPHRQYRSAMLARKHFLARDSSAVAWQKTVAGAQAPDSIEIEPLLMVHAAALLYRLAGQVWLSLPRLLAAAFWLAGGAALYVLAKRLLAASAAVFAVAFYLFLPSGIFLSRSFQPDSLMMMLAMFSLLSTAAYARTRSPGRLVAAGLLAGAAVFVKPHAAFIVLPAFAALAAAGPGARKLAVSPGTWAFLVLALAPASAFYLYGWSAGEAGRQGLVATSFMPQLFLKGSYYRGLLQMAGQQIGFTPFAVALLALLLVKRREAPGALLAGLWLGYLAMCLVFNHQTSTHPYCQLAALPLIALSGGRVGSFVLCRLDSPRVRWTLRAAVVTVLLAALALDGAASVVITRYRIERNRDFKEEVRAYEVIGGLVGHSTRCVFLARESGFPLQYHAWMSGWAWPNASWDISS